MNTPDLQEDFCLTFALDAVSGCGVTAGACTERSAANYEGRGVVRVNNRREWFRYCVRISLRATRRKEIERVPHRLGGEMEAGER